MSTPKTCKCAAHSYAECICGAWDDLNPHTLKRERDEARAALREVIEDYASKGWWTTGDQESSASVLARWRKAARIDAANTQAEGRASRTLPRLVGGLNQEDKR